MSKVSREMQKKLWEIAETCSDTGGEASTADYSRFLKFVQEAQETLKNGKLYEQEELREIYEVLLEHMGFLCAATKQVLQHTENNRMYIEQGLIHSLRKISIPDTKWRGTESEKRVAATVWAGVQNGLGMSKVALKQIMAERDWLMVSGVLQEELSEGTSGKEAWQTVGELCAKCGDILRHHQGLENLSLTLKNLAEACRSRIAKANTPDAGKLDRQQEVIRPLVLEIQNLQLSPEPNATEKEEIDDAKRIHQKLTTLLSSDEFKENVTGETAMEVTRVLSEPLDDSDCLRIWAGVGRKVRDIRVALEQDSRMSESWNACALRLNLISNLHKLKDACDIRVIIYENKYY